MLKKDEFLIEALLVEAGPQDRRLLQNSL